MQPNTIAILLCLVHSVASDCRAVGFGIEKFDQLNEDIQKALGGYLREVGYAVNGEDSVTHYLLFEGNSNPEKPTTVYVCFVQKSALMKAKKPERKLDKKFILERLAVLLSITPTAREKIHQQAPF